MKRNPFDGLIHEADGSRWDAETDTKVEKVNDYHQMKSKHKNHHEGSVYHEPIIKPWHLGEIGESESVTEAMDRQLEIDAAEQEMVKKSYENDLKAVD